MSAETDETTISRQVPGFWFEGDRPLPKMKPAYRPTGAVLPRLATQNAPSFDGGTVLDLVRVEDTSGAFVWVPLSEAGQYTWSHTLGLLRGEPWLFVLWRQTKRFVFAAKFAPYLQPRSVNTLYGVKAAERARPDRRAVQLVLKPVPT